MKTIEKQCLYCNKLFHADLKEHNRGNGKYCSKQCSYSARKGTTKPTVSNVTCAFCQKGFYLSDSKRRNSRSGLFFCCRSHKDAAQRIGGIREIMPEHYGNGSGVYREIAFRSYPHECSECGYNKYVEVLQVHHKDHNRANNDVSNLAILCPTCHWTEHLIHSKS